MGIWLGAFKPRMLRLVGRRADGWLPSLGVLDKDELASPKVADLLLPGYAKPVMSRSETSDRAAG
jgi:hypothetical protein